MVAIPHSGTGALLLGQAHRKFGFTRALADRIVDIGNPSRVAHTVVGLLRERIFASGSDTKTRTIWTEWRMSLRF
ncbi:MAG TPA: hypothetical protein VGS41_18405, partial [Chthonomonadales bacterium]|nr:hypothetical protein [Chthonomonadales bacterium]